MHHHSQRPQGYFWVDWWLLNHCGYHCHYCADIIHNGSIPWPDLEACQRAVDTIAGHCRTLGIKARYHLTGGEVTEWPWLLELLEHMAASGSSSRIRTNAALGLDRYLQILPWLESVNLEYHPGHANPSHFLIMVKASRDQGIGVSVTINMVKQHWTQLEQLIAKINELWPDQGIYRKMVFVDPVVNVQPSDYDSDQIKALATQPPTMVQHLETTQTGVKGDYQTMILENKNHFRDWFCWSGVEQLVIDAYGRVFRGHCRQGGKLGTIYEGFAMPKDPIQCASSICRNSFDMESTKKQSLD